MRRRSSSPTRPPPSWPAAATPCCARSRATSSATSSCAATSSRSTASRRRSRPPRPSCASSPSSSSRATTSRPARSPPSPTRSTQHALAGGDPRGRRLEAPLQAGRAEDRQPEALRRLDPPEHDHVRHRPGRHRQDVPRRRARRRRAEPPRGQPDHPHAPRGRGRRAPRLPARRPHGEDRPLPAPAVRRAARHARRREGRRLPRARPDRGRASGLHAGPRAACRPAGHDADWVAGDRDAARRRPRRRLRRTPDACARRLPAGPARGLQVQAQDGASTLCCAEHLWTVRTPDDRRRGKSAATLRTDEMIGRLRAAHQHRFELPLRKRAGRARAAGRPAGPVRARPAARGRLPDRDDDASLHDRRSGACRRTRGVRFPGSS